MDDTSKIYGALFAWLYQRGYELQNVQSRTLYNEKQKKIIGVMVTKTMVQITVLSDYNPRLETQLYKVFDFASPSMFDAIAKYLGIEDAGEQDRSDGNSGDGPS